MKLNPVAIVAHGSWADENGAVYDWTLRDLVGARILDVARYRGQSVYWWEDKQEMSGANSPWTRLVAYQMAVALGLVDGAREQRFVVASYVSDATYRHQVIDCGEKNLTRASVARCATSDDAERIATVLNRAAREGWLPYDMDGEVAF